jgi:hypothetical protein
MMFRSPGNPGDAKGYVEQGVEMAYRVIEEFMARGRRAAGAAGPAWTRTEPMQNNNPQNMAGMMMAYWMDMSRMWLGMMGPFMAQGFRPGGPAAGPYGQYTTGGQPAVAAPAEAGRARAVVELHTEQPAEVTVELQRPAAVGRLQVTPLTGTLGESPAIAGADVTGQEDGSVRLRVKVPAGQPRGFYRGSIVAADGTPLGTVDVRVLGRAGDAQDPSASKPGAAV